MNDQEKTELKEIENFAKVRIPKNEIAIILNFEKWDNNKNKAFQKGRLIGNAEIRKSIFEMARNGSSPAQKQFLELISQEDSDLMAIMKLIKKAELKQKESKANIAELKQKNLSNELVRKKTILNKIKNLNIKCCSECRLEILNFERDINDNC